MTERLFDTPAEQGCGCVVIFVMLGVGAGLLRLLHVATGSDTSGVVLTIVFTVSLALIVWPVYAAALLLLGRALGEPRGTPPGRRRLDPLRLWSGPAVGAAGLALSVASVTTDRKGLAVGAGVLILLWAVAISALWRRRRRPGA